MKTFTWTRDSHGLFDLSTKGLFIRDSNHEIRFNQFCDFNSPVYSFLTQEIVEGELPICQINEKGANFSISPNIAPLKEKSDQIEPEGIDINSLWSIVKVKSKNNKESNTKAHQLQEGNLIKLGRVRFRVQSISNSLEEFRNKGKQLKPTENLAPNLDSINSESETNSKMCRFCLFEQSDPEDPLIEPCSCTGSMKHIHINCLRKWLNSKLHTKKTDYMSSITWKSLECELCKMQYNYDLYAKGRKFTLVEIPEPSDFPFLQIELLGRDNNCVRGVYQISMSKKKNLKIVLKCVYFRGEDMIQTFESLIYQYLDVIPLFDSIRMDFMLKIMEANLGL